MRRRGLLKGGGPPRGRSGSRREPELRERGGRLGRPGQREGGRRERGRPQEERLRRGRRERGQLAARLLAGAWRSSPSSSGLSPPELGAIVPALLRQGSGALAWRRIRDTPLRDHPGAPPLQDALRYQTLRARLLEAQLAQVVARLRRAGVEAVLAKGWGVGRLYPEAGLRPYGDLDLLVPPGELVRAREALKALAAEAEAPPPVELHEAFNELGDRSVEELFERSLTETLQGVEIRILAWEDHLRLLSLHGLEHGLCRPLALCDVALVLESLPGAFDWELCARGERWLSEGVRVSLGLARELLGADLEGAGVPGPWREAPLPGWAVRAALEAFGAEAHYMDLPGPEELLGSPGALARAARLRWANPLEVTFRRRAPWNAFPRLPYQVADYLARGGGFVRKAAGRLLAGPGPGRQSAVASPDASRERPDRSPPGSMRGRISSS